MTKNQKEGGVRRRRDRTEKKGENRYTYQIDGGRGY